MGKGKAMQCNEGEATGRGPGGSERAEQLLDNNKEEAARSAARQNLIGKPIAAAPIKRALRAQPCQSGPR